MDATAGRTRVALLGLVAAAAIAVAGCEHNSSNLTINGSVLQPSTLSMGTTSVVTQIQPQFLARQSVASFGCPMLPPLATAFQIVVLSPRVDLFLDHVTLQFIDGSSIGGTLIPFPRPELNRLFGHTLVRATTSRTFPFTERFGCFPLSPNVLSARIGFLDSSGAPYETTLTARIQ